jgi:hypothetical protein
MCLPIKSLKYIVALAGWINIFLGLASFISGIVFSVKTRGSEEEFFELIDGVQ